MTTKKVETRKGETTMELIYRSPRGKEIIFDDYEDEREEYGTYWVYMCPSCHNKYRGLLRKKGISESDSGSGEGSCGVSGCDNENACWYVDFPAALVEEPGGKKYYRFEEQLRDIAKAYGYSLPKDPDDMNEAELDEQEKIASEFVDWIEDEHYIQAIPVDKFTQKPICM